MTPAAPALARTGEPIPGYRLRQRIGAGGYGEVWAVDAPGGLVKAIKFVYGQMDEARAAREFKSLNLIKGVRHPFLLSLERIEVVDGQLLIVCELADASLKDLFEQSLKCGKAGIPRGELLDHLRDAADALDYMNSQHSLQHLDVKPENLLLVGGRIKVADFGLVKDVQDASASLMGGLTPIYAPPEVFDARPSRRSDQYSLAIVYQEMLTGVLPFPGKTAAQLATQHLSARPKLEALPAADKPVIERALSKDPQQRFGSCREMVETLLHNHSAELPVLAQVSYEHGNHGLQATAMIEEPSPEPLMTCKAGASAPEQAMLRRLESAEQATAYAAQGRYEVAEKAAQEAVSTGSSEERPPLASLVDLPPPAFEPTSSGCRRTLFVGIGGLAGKSLQQLRRKLVDRCGAEQRRNMHFLSLDTDSRELLESTQGAEGEALALPLRKSADYRNDSQKYLDWLSRRWLFNIPRSQQTEGIRPFGRLAFVDHAEEILQRLREAISHLKSADNSLDKSIPPRVVLVGSSSGGAASGMVLDVTYAIRQLMDEQAPNGSLDLLLLHGTGRQPAAQELAAVNSFALLTELNHCLRSGGSFPGDFSCGLKSRAASKRTLENLYMVHLGQDLGSGDFHAACDRVAEYLFLDAATPVGNYLTACRNTEPSEKRPDVTLRTFGLCQIGFSESTVNRGVESLCRETSLRWYGEPKLRQGPSLVSRLADIAQAAPVCPVTAKHVELESLVSGQAKTLGLELDQVVHRLYLLAQEDLGGAPNVVFQRIIQEAPQNARKLPPVDQWFSGSARFFGALGADLESSSVSPLHSVLAARQAQIAAPLGPQLRDWLLAMPEDPAVRIYGGQWCAKWFRAHLKNLAEKAREMRIQIGLQLSNIEQKLALAAKSVAKNKDAESSPEAQFLLHCQLRLYQLAAHVTMQFAQNLASYVSQAHDQLHDLGRDVKHLADQFAISEQSSADAVELAALTQLRRDEEASALTLDKHFQENVFSAAGFRAVLLGGEQRRRLLLQLRHEARQVVLNSLRQVNLSTLVHELGKTDASGTSKLRNEIDAAQPWLQRAGGERRLMYVSGPGSSRDSGPPSTPETISSLVGYARFQELPAIVSTDVSQIVFCYEIGNVPLVHAAAKLIDNRPSYAEAASRLHARTDISWQELSVGPE